jgi:FAD/FMN-containing dehydrogenase/Fe-S oxidoreductase
VGVVVPKTARAARAAIQIAAEAGVPILPRGAGTSQCGQTVGAALVIDNSKWLNQVVSFDQDAMRVVVQPGIVLDQLNAWLKRYDLWYPVDVSTAAQATLGGMAGNNSCGSRSIAYGNMVHNVNAIDALLPSGELMHCGPVPHDVHEVTGTPRYQELCRSSRALWEREQVEIGARFPKLLRRVAGYNLDFLAPDVHNMARLLVGSEGTLAYFERLHLQLSPLPEHKVLGVCHFPRFHDAMDAAQHIVKLQPTAVELVDRTMIELAREIGTFRATVDQFLKGEPDAILLVEFAGPDSANNSRQLRRLATLLSDLGFPDSVVQITEAKLQREVWEVRKAGLNIMMSMKGDGKPVSFIEDCAVPLEHLAEYTRRLTEVFTQHGTKGTWYAHASVGCLHVRPILDMRRDGALKMRAIAEEACALVKEYKGAYSGEHGDGLVRSEWIEPFFGARLTGALAEIKRWFDPNNVMNPGKIVRPAKMDDRALFRYAPGYQMQAPQTVLDWSEFGGFDKAVEMCNNNGHCRKFDAGTMCPSFRATQDEAHVTRGRANTLRLAMSGQLGAAGLAAPEVHAALDLCVSCKGCKRECPTGVDMAKMKIEFLHHYTRAHGLKLRERLIAYLPRYAPKLARFSMLGNLYEHIPGYRWLLERTLGLARERSLPRWRADYFDEAELPVADAIPVAGEAVLLVDTFSRYFESENVHAAHEVLVRARYRVHFARAAGGQRPLCCGRTFLAAGLVDEARSEAQRLVDALLPYVQRGVAIVGLEPACLLTLRDELLSILPGEAARQIAGTALLFEEFIERECQAGRMHLDLQALPQNRALLHGHCHQKAFGAMPAVSAVLARVPQLQVDTIATSCCGMAGSFGFEANHYAVSMRMAEAALLPAVREADDNTLIIADGTSCRHQIHDGAKREALHVARVLQRALRPADSSHVT